MIEVVVYVAQTHGFNGVFLTMYGSSVLFHLVRSDRRTTIRKLTSTIDIKYVKKQTCGNHHSYPMYHVVWICVSFTNIACWYVVEQMSLKPPCFRIRECNAVEDHALEQLDFIDTTECKCEKIIPEQDWLSNRMRTMLRGWRSLFVW